MRAPSCLIRALVILLLLLGASGYLCAAPARVDVILWFDTEDYLLPADDDACKRQAELLTERHIRATFKVVGEKARVLERRGRSDVIKALKKHDIAYHSAFHSVHPTPTEYLADCGLLDGMAEFARREGPGAADVRRIFGVKTLSCYGQPGSSWAPQAVAALKDIGVAPHGIPCYVDEGEHVGIDEKPFWYEGALNVFHLGENCTRMDLHDPAALEPAKRRVSEIAQRLRKQDNGGLISIYYHPCEWVHREFWDAVNFSRGANPPPEDWKRPPQRSREETEAAFYRFNQYIDWIRAMPGIRFVTASDLPALYVDATRTRGCSERDLAELASRICSQSSPALDFQVMGNSSYSVADQFELITAAVARLITNQKPMFAAKTSALLGPDANPPTDRGRMGIPWPAFRQATLDTYNFIEREHRVPARVFIGPDPVAPGDFLVALASVYDFRRMNGALPTQQEIRLSGGVEVLPERHIAKDTPGLFGGWIIHKEDFRAPKLLELARLQAWTLKPTIRQVIAD